MLLAPAAGPGGPEGDQAELEADVWALSVCTVLLH